MAIARAKLVIGGLIMAGAMSYLAIAGVKSGWVYFVDVDQFVLDRPAVHRRARIHGNVAADGLDIQRTKLSATFTLRGSSGHLAIIYKGAVPEMFQAGRQVVVEGALDEQGVFQADVLLTKCASKYEGHGETGTAGGGGR